MTIDGKCFEGYPIAKEYRDKKTELKPVIEEPPILNGTELALHIFTILRIQKIEISALRRQYILEACEKPD